MILHIYSTQKQLFRQVLVHSPFDYPEVLGKGMTLYPATENFIGVTAKSIERFEAHFLKHWQCLRQCYKNSVIFVVMLFTDAQ